MIEHEKLRSRLKNVARGVTEYRMTVIEADALLVEFDVLKIESSKVPLPVAIKEHVAAPKHLDGGTF